MAYPDKYTEVIKGDNEDFFEIGGVDTEQKTKDGVSNLLDYVSKKTAIITTSSSISDKNAFYIVAANCNLSFPAGFEGLTIGLKLTATPTTVNITPTSPDVFEGGNPSLTTSDIREYCFVSGTWYRIR